MIDVEAVMSEEQADGRELEEVNPKPKAAEQKSKADPKFAEVNALMSKYDKAEDRVRWLNSPEYL
jgi:hypothetical protein